MEEYFERYSNYPTGKVKKNRTESDFQPWPLTDSQVYQACVVLQSIWLQDSQMVVL